ncbi:MAG: class C sortase [Clostridiales bacterium]|nr:class C sortase [Clostridiales bacterium]
MEDKKNEEKKKKGFFRRNWSTLLLFGILIVGAFLLIYPSASDYYNSFVQSRVIAVYDEEAAKLSEEEKEAVINEAREWNEYLKTLTDRWTLNDSDRERYMNILNITNTGIMGYISIPMANISLPIYHTTEDRYLTKGAGHIESTSFPVGGDGSHSAISGHRGLPSARLFTDLDRLNEGDLFQITVLTEKFTYEVDKISIVLPEDMSLLEFEDGADYCTLVTCTPYAVNTHRLLIRGHRVSNYLFDKETIPGDATKYEAIYIAPMVALPILIILVIILIIATRKPKNKKNKKGREENENEKQD